MILNRAKNYYENDNERLREQGIDKYRDLYDEEKKIKKENMEKEIPQYVCRKKTKTKRLSKKLS